VDKIPSLVFFLQLFNDVARPRMAFFIACRARGLHNLVFMERTLILYKPDAFITRKVGASINRFEEAGFAIKACKMIQLDSSILHEHYAHIAHLPFFPEIEGFMSSKPVIAMVLEADGVVARVRNLVGPTNSATAPAGTIRGDWGQDKMHNIIHASDSPEAAAVEIKRFFKDGEIF
jgi:nucleoside-diphosphate kinase